MVYAELSDEILAQKCFSGDNIAFEIIYEKYYDCAMKIFLSSLKNTQMAEDAVHDLFVKLKLKSKNIDKIKCFKAWFIIVAKRFAYDIIRNLATRPRLISINLFSGKNDNETFLENLKFLEDYNEILFKNQNIEVLKEAIKCLPEMHKEILVSCYFGDLKQKEIANKMNLPLGTLKSRLNRALVLLKENYEILRARKL